MCCACFLQLHCKPKKPPWNSVNHQNIPSYLPTGCCVHLGQFQLCGSAPDYRLGNTCFGMLHVSSGVSEPVNNWLSEHCASGKDCNSAVMGDVCNMIPHILVWCDRAAAAKALSWDVTPVQKLFSNHQVVSKQSNCSESKRQDTQSLPASYLRFGYGVQLRVSSEYVPYRAYTQWVLPSDSM